MNRAISLEIKQLKSLSNLHVDFQGSPITGIFGANGCGKSTVLHALACCYQPLNASGNNYKFGSFFIPTTDSRWYGSELSLTYEAGDPKNPQRSTEVYKKAARWTPVYARRPKRFVDYIGIITCVPIVEQETQNTIINYTTNPLVSDLDNTIKEKAKYVLNKDYTMYNIHNYAKKDYTKSYIGVEHGNVKYASLSMGAGEQRVAHVVF